MAGTDNGTPPGAPLHRLKEDLTSYAKDKAEAARDQAGSLVEERKTAAADELTDLSEALRQASEHLRARSRSMIAGFAQTTADQVESLATSVRDRDIVELLDDAQRFARRQPEVFFAGAVLLGFLFTRALRSTRASRAPTPTGDA
jgi:hypothetical protein